MIRKQIYITENQEHLLKRLSKARGVSEAELIRGGLLRSLGAGSGTSCDPAAWGEAGAFIRRLIAKGPVGGTRRWTRDQLYDRKVSG